MPSKFIVSSLLSYNNLVVFHHIRQDFPTMVALVHSIFSFPLKPLHDIKFFNDNRLWESQKEAERRALSRMLASDLSFTLCSCSHSWVYCKFKTSKKLYNSNFNPNKNISNRSLRREKKPYWKLVGFFSTLTATEYKVLLFWKCFDTHWIKANTQFQMQ